MYDRVRPKPHMSARHHPSSSCAGYKTQLNTFTAESRVRCLPYPHAVTGPVASLDDHTLAMPITNRRGDACVAIVDIKNRLELCSHVLEEVQPFSPFAATA